MNPFNLFKRSAPVETKRNPVSRVMAAVIHGQRMVVGAEERQIAREVVNSSILSLCVNMIASAVGSVKWVVHDADGEVTENHPALELLNRPNPGMSSYDINYLMGSNFAMFGSTFLTPVRLGDRILELWPVRADRMEYDLDKMTGRLLNYAYKIGTRQQLFPVDADGLSRQLLHIRRPNWENDYEGLSALIPAFVPATIHHHHMLRHNSILTGESIVPGVLATEETLTPDQFEEIKKELRNYRTTGAKAGEFLLLAGGKWDFHQTGHDPDKAVSIEAKNAIAREVATIMGIPALLLGLPGDNTFANYEEARLAFWEDTILPHYLSPLAAGLTRFLGLEDGSSVTADTQGIPALKGKRRSFLQTLDQVSFLTVNEKRKEAGYEPLEGGNELLVNSGQVPLSLATDPNLLSPPENENQDDEDEDEDEENTDDEETEDEDDGKSLGFEAWLERENIELAEALVS